MVLIRADPEEKSELHHFLFSASVLLADVRLRIYIYFHVYEAPQKWQNSFLFLQIHWTFLFEWKTFL